MNTELRKDCPMRHENGNCMPAGGFCTAVNNPICEALHNAYDTGRRAVDVTEVRTEAIKEFVQAIEKRLEHNWDANWEVFHSVMGSIQELSASRGVDNV